MFFSSSTLLQYHYLMSRFMYRFWVVKRGPVCLMGQHCVAFKKENSPIHLRGLAALVIWKVRVLWYEFTDVTLAWEDGQWVEAHKIILAGCSPKKAPQPSCLSWMVLILMSRKQKQKRQTGPPSGCPKLVLWLRQLKRGAYQPRGGGGVRGGKGDRNGQKFSGKLVTFETIAIEILPLSRSFWVVT